MSKTSDGAKLQPQFASSGNPPTFAADLTLLSDFFAARSFQQYSTAVALLAATSGKSVDDVAVAADVVGAHFRFNGSTWVMEGVAKFATTGASSTVLPSPVAGMRRRIATRLYDEEYIGSAWRPMSPAVFIVPTVSGSGVTVDSSGLIILTAASTISVNGLEGFRELEVEIEGTASSANNQLDVRVRTAAGVDDTSANYHFQAVTGIGSSASAAAVSGGTKWSGMSAATSQRMRLGFVIKSLDQARSTIAHLDYDTFPSTTPRIAIEALQHGANTAFGGLTFLTDTGTITGTIRVIGKA